MFTLLAKKLAETVANPESRWTPERSGSSAVAESRSGSGSGSSAVAESGSPASGTIDPMSQLEELGSDSATPKKRKGQYYESKRGLNRIQTVSMPEYEPISHPNRTEERMVRVLPLSTCSLYLCIDDIAWLVRWLGDELRSSGVPLESSDPVDALECNCNAENVHTRWDFGGSWEAIILACDNKGSKTTCSVEKFNEEKWLAVGASEGYGTDFGNATPYQKKGASFMFLEKQMK